MSKRTDSTGVHDFDVIGPVTVPTGGSDGLVRLWKAWYYGFPNGQYSALIYGELPSSKPTMVRISSMCIWGHLFGSQLCDCGWQLDEARRRIVEHGAGVIVFCHDQHGKGVGLRNHYRIYSDGQEAGLDLVVGAYKHLGFKEDYREYGDVARILRDLGVKSVRLLSNSPKRVTTLRQHGLEVEIAPIEMAVNNLNASELGVKKWTLHHSLKLLDDQGRPVPRSTIEQQAKGLTHMLKRKRKRNSG